MLCARVGFVAYRITTPKLQGVRESDTQHTSKARPCSGQVQELQELDVGWALWRLCPHSWGRKVWLTSKDIEQIEHGQRMPT